jgi:hypothetical protein
MMALTKSQGEALTALLHQLRKDWDTPGIRAALQKAATLGSPADLAVAACRVAANPEARTPALIAEPGSHWQGTAVGKRIAPVMCVEHPGEKAGHCRECVAQAVPRPADLVIPKRDKHQHQWIPQEAS